MLQLEISPDFIQSHASHYNTLQHITTHYNTLQHITTHYSTLLTVVVCRMYIKAVRQ